jgi:hypothetical protein
MLTILSSPKAFRGHVGVIQRNAVHSWARLKPRPEIILLGKEEGTAEVARESGVTHIPEILTNEHGTPLLSDALARVTAIARTPLLCLVNSDIILLQEFADAVGVVATRFPEFLAVAQRMNVELSEELDFSTNGDQRVRTEVLPRGVPGNHTSIDVFVFPAGMYKEVPQLILGRAWFDQWLIKEARKREIAVVDVTRCARAIHQNHDYAHIADGQRGAYWGEEALHNLSIYGGKPHQYTLWSVTHELRQDGSIGRVRMRAAMFAARYALWDLLIRRTKDVRDALGLRRKFWAEKIS